jgi:2-succinyl-5-enolpyruvyl-6-hydroxy-3-cyclohexene-1-carboxylate synthase
VTLRPFPLNCLCAVSDPSASRSLLRAANLNHLWAQLLIEELTRSGIDTFFLAPGSRSTPLTVAVARHPTARATIHVDERGTAFAALGYGRVMGRPAGWITTSGTAVANGLPAVVEAATDGVPMLLLTADRPPELRSTGANQTIDQVKIFGDFVRWHADLPTPTTDIAPSMVLTTADQAVHRATRAPRGPVHLNCMFRKPLEPRPDGADYSDYTAPLAEWAHGVAPHTQYPTTRPTLDDSEVDAVADVVNAAERGLLIAGRLDTQAERAAVCRLASHLDWPLIPDVTSGLRLGSTPSAAHIAYADPVLASAAFSDAMQPTVVLHIGGRFVSKRLQQYLEAAQPPHHIVVRPDPARIDPGHQVSQHIESAISAFCSALAERATPAGDADWMQRWCDANDAAHRVIDQFMRDDETLSEPFVACHVARHVPAEQALVLASSMPVRDMNRYGASEGDAVPVIANRGASGIDGTIATAAGVATACRAPVTLLIGDLALLHDLNALALLQEAPVIIIVINNNGGGIFHFLPIAEHTDVFEPYFATPYHRSFEQAAALFDLPYTAPRTKAAFDAAYRRACERGTSALIEVQTDRVENRALHDALEQHVRHAVQSVLP